MEVVLFIIAVVAVLYYFSQPKKRSRAVDDDSDRDRGELARKRRTLDANRNWLNERWKMADAEQKSGELKLFPNWYFDEATEAQQRRLARDDVSGSGAGTKGQLSDLIGIFEEPSKEELEKLKFFGVKLNGPLLNQTRARHEVALIDIDPKKRATWLARPATASQKEFYRIAGSKPPAGLTRQQAQTYIDEAWEGFTEVQQDEWDALERLVQEFEDRELREELEIRKPSLLDIRAAMAAAKADGEDFDDPYTIAEKLLEMKPSLSRN